jgi:hypothetical protein
MRTRILLLIKAVRNYEYCYILQTIQYSILSLHASIVSDHGPQLTFEPLELLIFNADPIPDLDPDLAFYSNADPDPELASKKKIKQMQANSDPDMHPLRKIPKYKKIRI